MFVSSFDISKANDFGGESNGSSERPNLDSEVGNRRREEPRCIRHLQEDEEEASICVEHQQENMRD